MTIPLEIGQQVWRFGMDLADYHTQVDAFLATQTGWVINFRTKGNDPQSGGFFQVDSTDERDTLADLLKDAGYRVIWEEVTRG